MPQLHGRPEVAKVFPEFTWRRAEKEICTKILWVFF